MIRITLNQVTQHCHSSLILLGIVMNNRSVVSKFSGFLVLTELSHVLVHLCKVGLRLFALIGLDCIATIFLGLGSFARLVHHEHGVVSGFFFLQEFLITHGTTAVTGGIGFHNPVKHLGGISILSHFLIYKGQIDVNPVFVPRRFLSVTLQECFISLNGFGILLLTGFQVTFLGKLGCTGVVILRNIQHGATDCRFSILYRFRILLVLLVPRRITVITLRSIDVVRVDGHQALKGLHRFFVTVVVLVLHTDTIVHRVLEGDFLVFQESFCFGDTTTFQVREGGCHEVHSFCAQVCRVFALVSTNDIIVVLDSSSFVFSNIVVRFSQVVHGKCSFFTRQVFKASHLLVGFNSVAELTVHEVVFSYTEPSLGNKAVVREVTDQALTKAESLFVFATSFLHGSSLI